VPDQETEETQPYAPKAGASSQLWEQRGRKKNTYIENSGKQMYSVYKTRNKMHVITLLINRMDNFVTAEVISLN
jgi:hypothetical protein